MIAEENQGNGANHPSTRADQNAAFFDALQQAVDEKGLERVSQEDIIRHTGVPRTTLYRRYGNRDEILMAFVLNRTAADIAECQRLFSGGGSLRKRFEDIMVFAIMAAHRHRWLQSELNRSASGATAEILVNAFQQSSEQTLIPVLIQAKAQGICRCPAPLDELRRWVIHQLFHLSRQHIASEEEARRIVRTYVLPVLAFDQPSPGMGEKIDFIYQCVKEMAGKA